MIKRNSTATRVFLALLRVAPLVLWILHPVAHNSHSDHGACASAHADILWGASDHGAPAEASDSVHDCHACSLSHTVRVLEFAGGMTAIAPAAPKPCAPSEPILNRAPLLGGAISWRGPPSF